MAISEKVVKHFVEVGARGGEGYSWPRLPPRYDAWISIFLGVDVEDGETLVCCDLEDAFSTYLVQRIIDRHREKALGQ